jgi:hypothetical protein
VARKIFFFVFFVFVLGTGSAVAQDIEMAETQLFDSGTAFSFPDGWEVEANEGTVIVIGSNLTRVTLVDYEHFTNAGVAATGQSKSFSWYFNEAIQGEVAFNSGDVEQVEIGQRAALRYDYAFDSGNGGLMLLVEFTDGGFGVVDAVSLDGDLGEADEVLAIAASFDSGGPTPLTGGASGGSDSGASSGVPCTVSTSQERTVRIRVGPGENRTSYTFLPTDTPFEVLGQATADDDSQWWKLDREVVAPNAAANEAWVAQDDVESEGGCGAVVDVNAPPIIPIIAAPPPEEPAEQPPAGSEGQPPAGGGTQPSPGTWTVYYPSSVPASCLGDNIAQETVWLDITEPPETVALTPSGRGFILGQRVHTPTGPSRYRGTWDFEVEGEVFTAESFLTVVSPAQMVGELRVTLVFDGGACSFTASITVTRG